MKSLTALALALALAAPAHARPSAQSWYWILHPIASSAPDLYIGPYPSLAICRDMLGSAIYSHPFACHMGSHSPGACAITGNGFAYPTNYPFPVPADLQLTAPDCVPAAPTPPLRRGWYFVYQTPNGAGIAACSQYRHFAAFSQTTPGLDLGHYADSRCSGAPCFSVGGKSTACN